MSIRVAPSLASAPTDKLGEVVKDLKDAGADYVHFDIEDGSFVPVMNLGTKMVGDLRQFSDLLFDVHLMMVNPQWVIPSLVEDGADRVSVHLEACRYPRRVLRQIHECGAQAGLAFNPKTSLPDLKYLFPYLSFVLILTTEPEGPDCPFLPHVLNKVRRGKQALGGNDYGVEWVVDGGVSPENIAQVVDAGADTVVVGREAFKGGDVKENIAMLRSEVG